MPYLASIPKRVFTTKIIAKSQNVQARKSETKNAPPNYNLYQLQQNKQNANLVKTQHLQLTNVVQSCKLLELKQNSRSHLW